VNDWASLTRKYLAGRDRQRLIEAIALATREANATANQSNKLTIDKIVFLLVASEEEHWRDIPALAEEIAKVLLKSGQKTWGLTARLLMPGHIL
jgi:hypothetical protein